MSEHLTELHELAMAALYFPEIARGVEGEFDISKDQMTEDEYRLLKAEIRDGQVVLYQAGWRQDLVMERNRPFKAKIEIGVWRKRFGDEEEDRWITCEIAVWLGVTATFKCSKQKPW